MTNFLQVTSFDPLLVDNSVAGPQGPAGADGATPNLQIGTVTTLPTGSPASASITGTPANPLLNIALPAGPTGPAGSGGSSVTVTDNGDGTTTITV